MNNKLRAFIGWERPSLLENNQKPSPGLWDFLKRLVSNQKPEHEYSPNLFLLKARKATIEICQDIGTNWTEEHKQIIKSVGPGYDPNVSIYHRSQEVNEFVGSTLQSGSRVFMLKLDPSLQITNLEIAALLHIVSKEFNSIYYSQSYDQKSREAQK